MLGIPISVVATIAGYFLFSAAVGAMSHPTAAQENGWYGWFYRFSQRLAANADRVATVAEARNPALGAILPHGTQYAAHTETDIAVSK